MADTKPDLTAPAIEEPGAEAPAPVEVAGVPEAAEAAPEEAEAPEPAEPPVPTEEPANPNLLGELEPGELAAMTSLRQQMRRLQTDIGGLEIRKARLIGNLSQVEQQLDHQLHLAGQRLGVPEGVQFQVGQDGKCYRMPQPGLPPTLQAVQGGRPPEAG